MTAGKQSERQRSTLGVWAWGTLAYNVAVVIWGAYVRASKSGAGCGAHWPFCHGRIVPDLADMTTRIELTHRVTSGVLGIVVLALTIATFVTRTKGDPARPAAAWLLAFTVVEALVGAAIVKLEYVAMDPSMARAAWMALHLANTFLLLASNVFFAHFASQGEVPVLSEKSGARVGVFLAVGSVFAVALTGSQAALADTLFPARSIAHGLVQDLTPGAHVLLKLRTLHPFVAMSGAVLIVGGIVATQSLRPSPTVNRLSVVASILVATQIALGFTNLALLVPIWTQLLHLFVADSLWITLVLLGLHALKRGHGASTLTSA